MTESQITFETNDGRELLLEGVHYDVKIDGLMATTAIAQSYTNPYDTNIEAVYTFPLTADAVLLGIEIQINDRVLKGTIKEKSQAEAEYEEAIDDGNRAIMVEKSSDGIYTVNIANLLPDDKISVTIEYTQLMEWRQDQVKWSLPTTIAPKYGSASDLNLDDVTDPSISLLAENLFAFNMKVTGVLADSDIKAPSHKIDIKREEESTSITLQKEKDFMDKDIVFTFKTQRARDERSFALIGKDFDGYAAIASFYPSFGKDLPKQAKSVTFVIDCSGSMSGLSIDRAKTALNKALMLFTEEDSFNIVKFGSDHETLFDNEVAATSKNLNIAKRMIRSLDANMGGTNMEEALQSAYSGHKISKDKAGYLFLITDGQIYDHDSVVASAKKSEMAHFVVGVGYASDDPLLKKIAKETRGSFENIDPNEKMDDYILNLFKKIDTPKALNIQVDWPLKREIDHTPNMVFDGDTLYTYATFNEKPTGEVTLSYTLENGNQYSTSVVLGETVATAEASIVSKLVIAKEIDALNSKRPPERHYLKSTSSRVGRKIVTLSTKYQLFSELTNYILVDEVAEDEKPLSLPEMHKVDNMMVESRVVSRRSMASASVKEFASANICYSMPAPMLNEASYDYCDDYCDDALDVPNFLRKEIPTTKNDTSDVIAFDDLPEATSNVDLADIEAIWDAIDPSDYEKYLVLLHNWFKKYNRLPRMKNELVLAGFEHEIVSLFESKNFRVQIKSFALNLYQESDDSALSDVFVEHLEKILGKLKPGPVEKVMEFTRALF